MLRGKKDFIASATDTLIGEGTVVEGQITSASGLRIEGHVNGEIHCTGDVTIGEKGIVRSDIYARNIINGGTIEGAVSAKDKLVITPTGVVIGSISVAALSIVEGGVFQGTSQMEPKQTPAREKSGDPIPLVQKDDKESKKDAEKDKTPAAG